MTYHISDQAAWNPKCKYSCVGRKARCVLPFRKDGRGSRKYKLTEERRGSLFLNIFFKEMGWKR